MTRALPLWPGARAGAGSRGAGAALPAGRAVSPHPAVAVVGAPDAALEFARLLVGACREGGREVVAFVDSPIEGASPGAAVGALQSAGAMSVRAVGDGAAAQGALAALPPDCPLVALGVVFAERYRPALTVEVDDGIRIRSPRGGVDLALSRPSPGVAASIADFLVRRAVG